MKLNVLINMSLSDLKRENIATLYLLIKHRLSLNTKQGFFSLHSIRIVYQICKNMLIRN